VRNALVTLMLASAVGFTGLAVLAGRSRPGVLFVRVWVVFCAVMAATAAGIAAFSSGVLRGEALQVLLLKATFTGGTLTMFTFHAFAVALTAGGRTPRLLLAAAALFGAVVLGLFWFTRLMAAGVTTTSYGMHVPQPGPLMAVYFAYVAFNGLWPTVLLVVEYRRARARERL